MHKRKFKINILDLAIVVALICSVAALVFRDNITETFGHPQMASLQMTFVAGDATEENITGLVTNSELSVQLDSADPESKVYVKLNSLKTDNEGNTSITVVCTGYSRLGRFYSESNEKINLNTTYTLTAGDANVEGMFKVIEIKE